MWFSWFPITGLYGVNTYTDMASTDTKYGSVWQWHEHVPIVDGLRRSKRVAASMTGAENDTQHAHKRGKHERVIATVYVGVEPWRDK